MNGGLRRNHQGRDVDPIQGFATKQRLKTRVDDDGTRIIPGKYGHIFEYDTGQLAVMVIPDPPRKNYWTFSRTKLLETGFVLLQNGDSEGSALFSPDDAEQAKLAIQVSGLKRKRTISPQQGEKQIAWLRAAAGRAL
jgi:hypothetical protein